MESQTEDMPSTNYFTKTKADLLRLYQDGLTANNSSSENTQRINHLIASIEEQFKDNPPQSQSDVVNYYLASIFALEFLPNNQSQRDILIKISNNCLDQKNEFLRDFEFYRNGREHQVANYFSRRNQPYDYSVIYSTDNEFANKILDIDCDKIINKQQQKLKAEYNPDLVIDKIPFPPAKLNAIWMSCQGLKPDIQKIQSYPLDERI